VDYGQGYALGRPGSLDALLAELWRNQPAVGAGSESTNLDIAPITVNG